MKKELVRFMAGILMGAATLGVLTACGGSTGSAAPTSSAPAATVPAAPATSAAPAAANAQPPAQTGNQAANDLLAKGKLVFDKTAGGTGCAYCHGFDGKGAGPAGVGAPDNRGASEEKLRNALAGGVPLMTYIKLTDEEITAVVAYLKYLNEQP